MVQRESSHEADRDARDVVLKGKVARRGDDLYLENQRSILQLYILFEKITYFVLGYISCGREGQVRRLEYGGFCGSVGANL